MQHIEREVLVTGGTPRGSARDPGTLHAPYITKAEGLWQDFLDKNITRDQLKQGLDNLEKSYKGAHALGRFGRVLGWLGIALTVKDLAEDTQRSFAENSPRPIIAGAIKAAGGWGGAFIGFQGGVELGSLLGIETGPGAILTALGGGVIGGFLGYFAVDDIASTIDQNRK